MCIRDSPKVNGKTPVAVALLVPGGSGSASDSILAQSLENAARLAMADLSGVTIDPVSYTHLTLPTSDLV